MWGLLVTELVKLAIGPPAPELVRLINLLFHSQYIISMYLDLTEFLSTIFYIVGFDLQVFHIFIIIILNYIMVFHGFIMSIFSSF